MIPRARPALLPLALALALAASACSESAIRIRLVFPDQASITRARRLTILLVDPARGGWTCATARGRDAFGEALIASRDYTLGSGADLTFPQVPMQPLLVSALVHDKGGTLYLIGCAEVQAEPGDDLEVVVKLDCASGQSGCRDDDGDGVDSSLDCDDSDPCRSGRIKEAQNLCGTSAAAWSDAWSKACRDKLAAAGQAFTPPLCGDGIDQDCDGKDLACAIDDDCDGYSPPQDCDDKDATINPQATEICDGKDNNCNQIIDEGCLPCDVDGDRHGRKGYQGAACNLPLDDPDDYDAGVHPGVTADTGGLEGGSVLGALRGFCSKTKDKNGNQQVAVDHDGDGKAAKDDGCPSPSCDKDGDGFMGAQCSPPKSQQDCDDGDPHVFPGAPELCGDGKAQNCLADRDCSCDGDGDGYCPPDDCDDKLKAVAPWATEICDQVDNDCDKLVDEGNPDATGALIPTNVKLCTDDNDGQCAPDCTGSINCAGGRTLSGICACSGLDTSTIYKHDAQGDRTACQGEALTAAASPRCFEATQPRLERCDSSDWDCDGKAFVAGQVFADLGKTCGLTVGTCKAGLVTGCDPGKSVPNAQLVQQVLQAQGVAFNVHWLCSADTLLPVPEACDGKDDDCDGKLAATEVDDDKDGYLSCSGCTTGSGRTDLAASYKGCGDCNDGAPAVYPGATELCNGVDDNCQSGTADDGAGECVGGSTCCSAQKACRQLATDFNNCGSCGQGCDSTRASACVNGACVCGSLSAACAADLNCVSGSCQCIPSGNCSGCCDKSGGCKPGTGLSACGKNGQSCSSCSSVSACQLPVCTAAGTCTTTPASNGAFCSGGRCYGGTCCTGCVVGSTCYPGTDSSACGANGLSCQVCSGSQVCTGGSCL